MNLDQLIVLAGLAVAGIFAALIRYAIRTNSAPVTTEAARKHHTNLDGTYRTGRVLR